MQKNMGAAVLGLASVGMLLLPPLGQTGSVSSLSSEAWNHGGNACILCHFGSDGSKPNAWRLPTTTHSYIPYSSGTLKASIGQPSPMSLVCLSCHDGTVAVDSATGAPRSLRKSSVLGTDLRRNHPVSFTYDSALARKAGMLFDPSTRQVPALGSKTIRESMLFDGKVECSSCHDVHKIKGVSAQDPYDLIVPNTRSEMCFTCHDK